MYLKTQPIECFWEVVVAKGVSPKFHKYLIIFILAIAVACLPIFIQKAPRIPNKLSQAAQRVEKFIKWDLNPGITVTVNEKTQTSELPKLRSVLATGPLRVSPDNPRYFTNNSGKAIYLTGSHTWANLQDSGGSDPPPVFNYSGYLNFLQTNNHNFIELWTWEQPRWTLETYDDNYWIEPIPYQRTGPGLAADGKPKFDLTLFNQTYFDRLRVRVKEAGDRGIYVAVGLFNGWSVANQKLLMNQNNPWKSHPFNKTNNINGINGDPDGKNNGETTHTLTLPAVTALQESYIRKVIDTVNDLDNVLYLVSKESQSGSHDWQYHMINYIKNYEVTKPKQHPVGMTVEFPEGDNAVLFASPADWISPKGDINNPPVADGSKVIIADTDHLCGICGDRQWVWKSFTRGENPIFMDVYDSAAYGQGAAGFDPKDPIWVSLRKNLGYTLTYANRMNLAVMKPRDDLASTDYCLANPSKTNAEYLVYLPLGGKAIVDLADAEGELAVEWFNPSDGTIIDGITTTAGGNRSFVAPFEGDAVLYIKSI
jgi:hypothetical protein